MENRRSKPRVEGERKGGEPQAIASVLAEMFRSESRRRGPGATPPGPAAHSPGAQPRIRGGARGRRAAGSISTSPSSPSSGSTRTRPGNTTASRSSTRTRSEGRDGEPVAREWKAYPGPFGFGGPSTQVLLYDLLQLYAEQGAGARSSSSAPSARSSSAAGSGTRRSGTTSGCGGTWTSSAATTSTAGTPSGTSGGGRTWT